MPWRTCRRPISSGATEASSSPTPGTAPSRCCVEKSRARSENNLSGRSLGRFSTGVAQPMLSLQFLLHCAGRLDRDHESISILVLVVVAVALVVVLALGKLKSLVLLRSPIRHVLEHALLAVGSFDAGQDHFAFALA